MFGQHLALGGDKDANNRHVQGWPPAEALQDGTAMWQII